MNDIRIPFNRSSIVGREHEYITQAMANGQIGGDQAFGKKCEALLSRALDGARTLLTTSCTHALEMAALLLNVGPGDEVIVPSFTFVSTANAFALRGARPVFADILPDTLNIDPSAVEERIGPRTKAIVVVHYAGVGCEMEEILRIAGHHGIPVVEDNAHGLFGKWNGRPLGTIGCLATQSFHETKNFTCGEGGALVVNDSAMVERAEIIREKGTNRSRFFRGQIDKYTWVDFGSSYVMSDVLAAFLLAQLEMRELVQARRQDIWQRYNKALRGWADAQGVRAPYAPDGASNAWHMYYLVLRSLRHRQELIAHLRRRGIAAVFHYLPLHLSDMGRRFGGQLGDCPIAEYVSDRVLRLPFFFSMSNLEQEEVIETIQGFAGDSA